MFIRVFLLLVVLTGFSVHQTVQASEETIIIGAEGPAIIKLEQDAASVIIGNPAHAQASMLDARTVILSPAAPGATSFSVMNKDGEVFLQKFVVVNAPKSEFMRINRVCANAGEGGCEPVSVYYCPKGCHEMQVSGVDSEAGGPSGGDEESINAPMNSGGMSASGMAVPPEFQE
jgi:hypothetical protein